MTTIDKIAIKLKKGQKLKKVALNIFIY